MAEISVIVPVYKVEPYIHRCVDSILAQSFADFELILVDDGSPDNCGEICDEYARKDNRVHVIHQKNGGLSAARNAGIDWLFMNSDSQWITFVDSDDWVHSELLSCLYNAAVENDVNVSVCDCVETLGETPEIQVKNCSVNLYSPESAFSTVAWGKLYHRDCFNTIRFPVGKIHEDEFTTYLILFQQEKIAVLDVPLYFYFYNSEGITKSCWSPRRLDAVEAKREQTDFFKKNGFKQVYFDTASLYAATILQHRGYVRNSNLDDEEKQYYDQYLFNCLKTALWDYKDVYLKRERWLYREVFPGLHGLLRKMRRILVPHKKG